MKTYSLLCLAMKTYSLVCLAACLAIVQTAVADPVLTSQIVGWNTGPLGQAGNTEFWNGTSGNITVTNGSGSLDGTGLGLTASRGDKAEISATDSTSLSVYNLFAAAGQFRPDAARNLYYSFLLRFNNPADVSSSAERLIQVNRQNSGSSHTLQGWAKSIGDKVQIGVAKNGGVPVYAPKEIAAGETVLVVYRHQIVPPAGSGDVVDVWVNPPTNSFSVDEAITPPPPADASANDGTEDTSNTGPGRFYLGFGLNAAFDELRIATNWMDAVPYVGLCDPATINAEPVDVAVTEGIPATFAVGVGGSSPSIQWQVSRDDGTTWSDVSGGMGGTTPKYTTPMATLADNGTKYRAVVNVYCGTGSSATSAPVALAVNAAVKTPVGTVIHDVWTNDYSPELPPINATNSIWYYSSGSLLSVDQSTGTLVGTPNSAAGTSSLWIGYFTPESDLPVSLDVGHMIRASLQIKGSMINSANGALRIGLFDYADGGTRVQSSSFTGSQGNGAGVRGYMLSLFYSQTFLVSQPMQLLARRTLDSINLMGSTGDYVSLGSGPPGTLTDSPAFLSDLVYTLEFMVTRTNATAVEVTTRITGNGQTWTHTVGDSVYNYHRFDAIALRPASQEATAQWFEFPEFKVEVVQVQLPPPPAIPLGVNASGGNVTLTWSNPVFKLQASPTATDGFTNVTGATSPYIVPATGAQRFFRLLAE